VGLEFECVCNLGQRIPFHEDRACIAQEAFIPISVFPVQKDADDAVEYRIPEILQLFIVGFCALFFFQERSVRDRVIQERAVLECVPDGFFQGGGAPRCA